MKVPEIVQAILSALLLATVVLAIVLFGSGVLAVRCYDSSPPPGKSNSTVTPAVSPLHDQPSQIAYEKVAGVKARLICIRGLKIGVTYPIYEGMNFLGRADEKPVDIDLDDQEPNDRVWSSRQHALVKCTDGKLTIEDLNSANGTFVNRERVFPGNKRTLQADDVIQVGTVHLKVAP